MTETKPSAISGLALCLELFNYAFPHPQGCHSWLSPRVICGAPPRIVHRQSAQLYAATLPTFSFLQIYLVIWLHLVLVVAYGIFGCSTWDLLPLPGISALGTRNLSHWTTRDVPTLPTLSLCINVTSI